ncbi:nucleoside kinase [Muricomes sp. OA1]|uniref:Nucleoside kinase n=1 Tax=Hungatella hathewayi TaxID=154046 RepID=A0A3E2WWU2_9FIRM|nr:MULTISPECIES: nucleoside kinase [Clostridia]MEE0201820.1 nucleoside kinase [Muricomes sp.]MCH1974198.1 nucleoside kinase [Muricomes sp. OA1]MRM88050.1 nucleoside kinase [Faecalicatena contorta]RGC32425.1 nucleoside kinase [Hungatella hathewayi]GKH32971.1 uridine kinase [Faecalicatena contorta]
MESTTCTVRIGEETKEYAVGTTYQEIAQEYQARYGHQIVLVFINQFHLQELDKKLEQDCREIEFITTGDPIGYETYKRSLCFMLVKAVHDVGGHDKVERVRIHFSMSKGYYCTVEGDVELNQEFLDQVDERMKELVAEKIRIEKRSVHTTKAVELFRKHGMFDKERLFEYRRVSKVNIYSMNEFEDYYYGYMVPDAGYLKYYALYLYDEGFIIQMPTLESPETVEPFSPRPKLFQVLKRSVLWGDMQGIDTVGALNDMVTQHDMSEVVLVQEAYQERQIGEIAKQIADRPEAKFVLIAGPSSSGKTTFSHRLSIQLRVNGLQPHPIAVDNYFVDRERTPRDENGEYNFECLEAIDVDQFNEDMQALLSGREVYLPTFNFKTGKKEYGSIPKKLNTQDILVIEGIHCLNPKLTESLNNDNKFKIYISALTQLNIDEHNRIPSTDGRLIRRIVRDARTRGNSAKNTIARWPSVRKGEEENIFPYQEEADVMFNSSLLYELAVLKQYVEPLLFGMGKDCPEYVEAKRLLKFFDYFVGIGSESVPTNSLLREFIGGGCFNV